MDHRKNSKLTKFILASIDASGLTYEEIANRCGYTSDRSLRAMAMGKIPVPIDQAKIIAEALGCDPDRLTVLVLQTFLADEVILQMGQAIQKYPPRTD